MLQRSHQNFNRVAPALGSVGAEDGGRVAVRRGHWDLPRPLPPAAKKNKNLWCARADEGQGAGVRPCPWQAACGNRVGKARTIQDQFARRFAAFALKQPLAGLDFRS